MPGKKIDTVYIVVTEAKHVQSGPNNLYIILWVLGFLFLAALILINLKSIKRIFINIRPKSYKVEIPGFSIEGNIQYTSISQDVSWKIYIELITRVSANRLDANTGILRETLNSLYSAFGALRDILKNTSAELAKEPLGKSNFSVASLTLIVMNQQMRPFLSKWHPALQEYEKHRLDNISQFSHEQKWDCNEQFREELNDLQTGLNQYVNMLRCIAAGKEKT
jgi:hypothetical protein